MSTTAAPADADGAAADADADAVFAAAVGQGHDWIAARVPHQGRMCLLDGVLSASAEALSCTAHSHRAPDHPLRRDGRLGAACGIEYAAQAMALHGALAAQARAAAAPRMGFLVSVRAVALHVARLDDVAGALHIHVQGEADNGDHSIYAFSLHSGAQTLIEGRAVVMLDVPEPVPAARAPLVQPQAG